MPRRDDPRMHTAEFAAFTSESPSPAPAPPRPLPLQKGLPWVALGGASGALARWILGQILPATTTFTLVDLPWSTFLANVIGCFLIGALTGVVEVCPFRKPQVKLAVGVGFCGGFTTMSTFVLEVALMLGASYPLEAFQYTVTSIVFSLGAVVAGFFLGTWTTRRYLMCEEAPTASAAPAFLDDFTDVPSNDVIVGATEVADTHEREDIQ